MNQGHNILAAAVDDARNALNGVWDSENDLMAAWVVYGQALVVGRQEFASNKEFGKWVEENNLHVSPKTGEEITRNERAAAIWAASDPMTFEWAKTEWPNARTIRGLHTKFKESQKEVTPEGEGNGGGEGEDNGSSETETVVENIPSAYVPNPASIAAATDVIDNNLTQQEAADKYNIPRLNVRNALFFVAGQRSAK